MKTMYKLFTLMLILAFLLAPASPAYAKGLLDGRVIFGDDFTLESGDTLAGDLVVFGGNVTIEQDAAVQGDMVVFGGNVTLNGQVERSVVIVGGAATLGETSVVQGDLVTVGGSLTREPGSEVRGDVISDIPAPDIQIPDIPRPDTPIVPQPDVRVDFNPLARFFQTFFTAIAVAALAMLAGLFLQPQMERISQAVTDQPIIAGSFGLLTVAVVPVITLILIITIILIPVAALVIFGVALAWLFGVIALGLEVGERFARTINQTWAAPLTAGFGTFLMMLVVGGIGMVPCVGWLAPFLVALLGIGGVVLTLFGSRVYPRVVAPVAPPPGNEPVG